MPCWLEMVDDDDDDDVSDRRHHYLVLPTYIHVGARGARWSGGGHRLLQE